MVEPTPTQEEITVNVVQQTATALALTLQPIATSTPGPTGIGGPATPTPFTALPETGLFDDMTSTQGLGAMFLMAFGLVGVIVFSRKAREANRRNRK